MPTSPNAVAPTPAAPETSPEPPSTLTGTIKGLPASRLGVIRACVACRQMKMKCEGADNPPCKRCKKVGRECIPQSARARGVQELQSPQQQRDTTHPQHLLERPTNTIVVSMSNPPQLRDERNSQQLEQPSNTIVVSTSGPTTGTEHTNRIIEIPRVIPFEEVRPIAPRFENAQVQNLSELPSIYSTPPVDTVTEQSGYHISPRTTTSFSRKRKRLTDNITSGESMMSPASYFQGEVILTTDEMKDMIQLFCQRHLTYIPALHYENYDDAEHLIEKELPFVYCICYVTARYLPGGKEIRERLLPEISRYPREIFAAAQEGQPDDWIILKGLMVLYAYSDLTPPSQPPRSVGDKDILYWPLKYAVEVLALRLSLHRSIQYLRSDLQTSSTVQLESLSSYRNYTIWLWLFNMAHYCSIVSGTPPSIRIDYSIRAASSIVDKIGKNLHINNLFGIVELYLIWEKASVNHPQLGEWWCLPDPTEVVDEKLVDNMIKETDQALDAWRARWDEYIRFDDRGAFLEYHARYTRFCITSYAVKCVRSSPQGLTSLQTNQIARCVECANHVLDWPLSRGPIQKDRLRYVDDAACIMISFCALFILSTCQAFTSCIPNIAECIDNVTEAAQIMVDLAINSEQKPYIQGASILKRAEALKVALENARNNEGRANLDTPADSREPYTPDSSALVFEGLDSWFSDDHFFGMEPIWHFPKLLPDA